MEDEKEVVEEEETSDDESVTSEEDKTSEKKNEEGDETKKPKRSDIAQKIKFREKLKQSQTEVEGLKAELADLRGMVKKPSDDAEAKAQEYIRTQARTVFEELKKAELREKEKTTAEFEDKVDAVLESNPDISEEELLEAVEEYEVEPQVAVKILKKASLSVKKDKPKMPQSKRATSSEVKDKPDDKKKSFWDIVKEEKARLTNK